MDLSKLEIRDIPDPWQRGIDAGWNVVDGVTVRTDRTLEADVAIIGSGAGGAVAAEILSAAGLKVILIEEARLQSSNDFNLNEGDAYRNLYQDGAARVTKDGAIAILQGRAVGGTTVVNWTSSFRTPPQTLDFWRDNFAVRDLDRESLDPWFARMEKRLNINRWAMPPNANNDILKRGCERLGWSWDLIPRNVSGCWNLGYCGMGCPVNAKQSMLVTTLPAAMEHGATLLHSVRAQQLAHDGTRITAVECLPLGLDRNPTGARLTVRAGTVISAGGGINTPALLMRSSVPDPFARVGKRTFLHTTTFAFGDYGDEVVNGFYGAPQSVYSDEFVWRDGPAGAAGYKLEMMPMHPGLMASLLGSFGDRLRGEMERLPNLSASIAMLRDGFHPESEGGTVELADDGAPVLDYPLSDYLLEGARRSHLSMVEMHFAAGARRARAVHGQASFVSSWKEAKQEIGSLTYQRGYVGLGSAHVMGGCGMGEDEKLCVTDSDGRYRHLDNLYVFDGSVFPTSLGVNPQLTIYGITARNASRLAATLTANAVASRAPGPGMSVGM